MSMGRLGHRLLTGVLAVVCLIGCRPSTTPRPDRDKAPLPKMTTIEFVPIGEVDEDLVETVARKTADVLGTAYRVASDRLAIPEESYDARRRQYLAVALLERLKARPLPEGGCVLGLADVDLYATHLNFVFGQAELGGRVGVLSVARLRQEFWRRKPAPDLLLRRTIKEAVHELAHALGLEHCSDDDCVMYFSNSLADTDHKSQWLCSRCLTALR